MMLYKFYSPDTIKALQNSTLAFTRPSEFNDPMEMLPRIVPDVRTPRLLRKKATPSRAQWEKYRRDWKAEGKPGMTKGELKRLLNSNKHLLAQNDSGVFKRYSQLCADEMLKIISEDFGVLSLSENWNNPLMWGHYASGFTGFCVGYNLPEGFEGTSRVKVNYSLERFPVGEAVVLRGGPFPLDLVQGIVGRKSLHWAYEEEVRYIIWLSRPGLVPNERSSQFYYQHPSHWVGEIYLGMRCNKECRHAIAGLLNIRYPGARFFSTRACDSTYSIRRDRLR
jgi:hypothetical protein